jgi:NADPH2:quinone reductase
MKVIHVHEYGDPDALRYDEAPAPEPGDGEVRIRVEAAGVNFIDIYHRTGAYALDTPLTLGMEGAGAVDKVGPGVSALRPGDRVAYAMVRGAYAEYAVVPAWRLVPIPDEVSSLEAAAVMLQGMTAHYLTQDTYPLQEGELALIHAAAGGVGLLLVQMAKMRGARVIGTASTEEKAALAKEHGADEMIVYTEQDFEAAVKRLTGDAGVDVVYDSVGKTTFEKSLNCLKPRGYMVLYGQSSGAVPPQDPQILNRKGSLFLTRPSLAHYTASHEEIQERAADLFNWIASGQLQVRIDETFPLEDAPAAHRYMEDRKTKGKLLLIP